MVRLIVSTPEGHTTLVGALPIIEQVPSLATNWQIFLDKYCALHKRLSGPEINGLLCNLANYPQPDFFKSVISIFELKFL
jgi:hypothetical protein